MKKFYVFDVSNLFYRGIYGSQLTTSEGRPVQGLHGFIQISQGIIKDHKPDYMLFALEGGNQLRKSIDPNYKANRPPLEEDIKWQKDLLPELISAMGYPSWSSRGFEADDVINAMVKLGQKQNLEVVIVSSDKDFNCLLGENVSMYNLGADKYVTSQSVLEKYGITTNQFQDYLAIVGDTADNIKGVSGVGPKGAAQALQSFGTLENIYNNIGALKPSLAKKFSNSIEDVKLARRLVALHWPSDIPEDLDVTQFAYGEVNADKLKPLLRMLEFRDFEKIFFGAQILILNGIEFGTRK
jgi:DNA polymerase-1